MTGHLGEEDDAPAQPRGHRHSFPWGYAWYPPGWQCAFCDWGKQKVLW